MLDEMSETEKRILNFINHNLNDVLLMTSSELGKQSKTSAPSVIRFSQKLGFTKFTDFKMSLSNDVKNELKNDYSSIQREDSFNTAKEKLTQNAQLLLQTTSNLLEENDIMEIVHLLEEAQIIYIYAVGSSGLVAENIRQKWSKLGKTVVVEKDIHLIIQQMIVQAENCIFWGISHSGKNKEVLSLIKAAKEYGIPTMGLTQIGNSELGKQADFVLRTARVTEGQTSNGTTNSILIQFMTIDILFFNYIHHDETRVQKLKNSKILLSEFEKKRR